jgi:hypothetical protein
MIYAIKWLGNAGSHDGDAVSMDDVMDSYELLEHILEELCKRAAEAPGMNSPC